MKFTTKTKPQLIGISSALLASIAYASYGIWTRYAGESIGNFGIAFLRSVPAVALVLIIGLRRKSFSKIAKKDIFWISVYVVAGQFATHPFTIATLSEGMSLGEVLFLFYASSTIIAYLLAFVLYQEKLNVYKALALVLSFIGLGLMYEATFDQDKLFGVSMALLAGIGFGTYSTSTRKISRQYSGEQLNLLNYGLHLFTVPILILITNESINYEIEGTFWAFIYGIVALIAGYLVISAFKNIEAQKASLILLLEPVGAAIFGVLLFSEELSPQFIIAALLIIIGAALPNFHYRIKKGKTVNSSTSFET